LFLVLLRPWAVSLAKWLASAITRASVADMVLAALMLLLLLLLLLVTLLALLVLLLLLLCVDMPRALEIGGGRGYFLVRSDFVASEGEDEEGTHVGVAVVVFVAVAVVVVVDEGVGVESGSDLLRFKALDASIRSGCRIVTWWWLGDDDSDDGADKGLGKHVATPTNKQPPIEPKRSSTKMII
jgi:hypothetical protein